MGTHLRLQYLAVILLVAGCTIGFPKYTIEEVTQTLYDHALICSTKLNSYDHPDGLQVYILREGDVCLKSPGKHVYSGRIELYPTRAELRVSRARERITEKGPFSYGQFIKGNVLLTISPAPREEDAEKFRAALNELRK